MQKPTIGRAVHFVEHGRHYAALVTEVHTPSCVNLTVFGYRPATVVEESGEIVFGATRPAVQVTSSVQDEKAKQQSSWHWPEREDEKSDKPKPQARGKQQIDETAPAVPAEGEDAATDSAANAIAGAE